MHEKPQRAAAVGVDEAEESGAFFVELPGALGFESQQFTNAKSAFVSGQVFG